MINVIFEEIIFNEIITSKAIVSIILSQSEYTHSIRYYYLIELKI